MKRQKKTQQPTQTVLPVTTLYDKWLTSKVFVRHNSFNGGVWDVMVGSANNSFLGRGSFGIVLESYVTQEQARAASHHYQQLLVWRNIKLNTKIHSYRIRAGLAKAFDRRDLSDKWLTSKVVVHRHRSSAIGWTYNLQVASDNVSPINWVTLNCGLLTSRIEAETLAREYNEVLCLRNAATKVPVLTNDAIAAANNALSTVKWGEVW